MSTARKRRRSTAPPTYPRTQRDAKRRGFERASFLNIDVDVRSRRSLAALAAAWPWAQEPRRDSRWLVFSARGDASTAEATAKELVEQVNALSPLARQSWDLASKRTFDVGVQAGMGPRAFDKVQLSPETLARIASIRARIQVTVYPPRRG